MRSSLKACIFDLDGVIVDTARYHFLAWSRLAQTFGFEFREKDNEALKGVSRVRSLEIILQLADVEKTSTEKERLCELKNAWYLDYIQGMDKDEILPGVLDLINELRQSGIAISLGSASKNAPFILNTLEIDHLFDAIIDGNSVKNAKPDPEVFLKAAEELGASPENCIVFEDAEKGIEAAKVAKMMAIGIGSHKNLRHADLVIEGFKDFNLTMLRETFQRYSEKK